MNKKRIILFAVVVYLVTNLYSRIDASSSWKELQKKYKGNSFYLNHNLWHNDDRIIYWYNYVIVGQYIPIGTKVTVKKVGSYDLKFKFTKEGINLTYKIRMKYCMPDYDTIIARIFSTTPVEISHLNKDEIKNIKMGKIRVGMSRESVFLTLGYPPLVGPEKNPGSMRYYPKIVNGNLKADQLTYWKNRYDRIVLTFKNDLLVNIKD